MLSSPSSRIFLSHFPRSQACRSNSSVLSSVIIRSYSSSFSRSAATIAVAASSTLPLIMGRGVLAAGGTGNQAFSSSSSGSGRRPTGRDKNKETLFVPTPRNPKVLLSIPENAEYPTLPEEEIDEEEAYAQQMAENWRPGERKRPRQAAYTLEELLEDIPSTETRWTTRNKRCGAVALKLGMMPVWDDWGYRHPCTVLHLDSNVVLRVKTRDGPDGYDAVQIGAGERKLKNVKSTILGQLPSIVRDHPPHVIREFRITPLTTAQVAPPVGTRIHARHFLAGQCVDVSAISKGKGFQGTVRFISFCFIVYFIITNKAMVG